ncbi:MAG: Single-stranded DNA binding protein [Halobacteriaceae archaeon]
MSLDDHAEELASDLGVDKEEVERSLQNLVEYSVPIEEAKQSLRRKHGDGGGSDGGPSAADIADITTESGNVTVTARVLTVGKRPIRYQGEDRVIQEGELADATGRIAYTAWEEFDIAPGDTVRVGNASVREWEGDPELNLGENTTVERLDEDIEVPYEVGGESALADLSPGDRGRRVEAVVVEVEERTIDGRDGPTDILSGVLGDETARLPFTDWEPREAVVEGAALAFENVYVREFRGVPSVNLSEFSTVEGLDRDIEVGGATELPLREAVERGGVYDVAVTGTVLEVRDGSGLIQRCPECGRVVQNGRCRTHGDVEGEDDLRVKAILDDGTEAVTLVLDADLTAEVYGGGLAEAREAAREAMDQEVVAEAISEELVGREFRVRGHLSVDEYGANLEAVEFAPAEETPAERAAALLEGVE